MEPIIQIRDLYKNYGTKRVLKGISIDIYPGQVIGYIGPNGAGKSTTVKILCGLISDYTGSVVIKGIDVKKDPVVVKGMIGYVPEIAEIYDTLTPKEYLDFTGALYNMPEELITDRAEKMLEAFGLSGNMNQRMDTFSKGMKQKVLIISGIIHNPEIIIFDEPLSGLDANAVLIVKDLIDKLAESGKTIFYCSHMMDIVEKVSDRIILINDGMVVADGTFEELKQKQGDSSLEKIFARLTSDDSLKDASDKLMNVFSNH
jgi:ABC-2 type transport system ATP-binding protein